MYPLIIFFPSIQIKQYVYCLAMDYATRYAIARALPISCTAGVAHFLLYIILRNVAPRYPLTDHGQYFLAKVVDYILRACSTRRKLMRAYHPQTNRFTERLNRTNTDMLSLYASLDHRD